MADVLKNVTISDEIIYVGHSNAKPVIPASTVIPAKAGNHPDIYIDASAEMDPRLRGDDKIAGDDSVSVAEKLITQERAHLQDQTNALTTLLNSIPEAIEQNRQQLSTEIADIVLLIASKFFINQQQDKNAISEQITQILTQLNEKQNIEISLHPKDLALIQQGEIHLDPRSCKNLRLKPDENLRLGGCIIKSEHGVFDAGIERQIDNLKQVLLQMKGGS